MCRINRITYIIVFSQMHMGVSKFYSFLATLFSLRGNLCRKIFNNWLSVINIFKCPQITKSYCVLYFPFCVVLQATHNPATMYSCVINEAYYSIWTAFKIEHCATYWSEANNRSLLVTHSLEEVCDVTPAATGPRYFYSISFKAGCHHM